MTEEMFSAEKLYGVTMAIAKSMLDNELITNEEYKIIDKEMLEKYKPIFSPLLSTLT